MIQLNILILFSKKKNDFASIWNTLLHLSAKCSQLDTRWLLLSAYQQQSSNNTIYNLISSPSWDQWITMSEDQSLAQQWQLSIA